uniref:Uncharacterized protein n=1 Tax=Arundo donax TaxID=35708 RepID=A0A0A8YRJ3_ARUDO
MCKDMGLLKSQVEFSIIRLNKFKPKTSNGNTKTHSCSTSSGNNRCNPLSSKELNSRTSETLTK